MMCWHSSSIMEGSILPVLQGMEWNGRLRLRLVGVMLCFSSHPFLNSDSWMWMLMFFWMEFCKDE